MYSCCLIALSSCQWHHDGQLNVFLLLLGLSNFSFEGIIWIQIRKRENIETIRDYEQCCQTFIPPHMFQVHLYQALKMLFCWKIFSWFHRWKITYRNLLKSLNYEYFVSFMPTIMDAKYKTKLQVIKDKQRMSFWREYF